MGSAKGSLNHFTEKKKKKPEERRGKSTALVAQHSYDRLVEVGNPTFQKKEEGSSQKGKLANTIVSL